MSRMLSKMNLISVVQQLPKEDVETIQGYVEMIEEENKKLKAELQLYQGALKREHEAIHRANDLEEIIDKAINNSQDWIDFYTKLNSDERIALRLQENIDILKEVK